MLLLLWPLLFQDHPRRCGENGNSSCLTVWCAGSPPQVRGKLYYSMYLGRKPGITPAGAGKTFFMDNNFTPAEDHPRRCGENADNPVNSVKQTGSPPQVRGKRMQAL